MNFSINDTGLSDELREALKEIGAALTVFQDSKAPSSGSEIPVKGVSHSIQKHIFERFTEEQNRLTNEHLSDGLDPIVKDGYQLIQLLQDCYGPWQLIEILQYQSYFRGPLTKDVIDAQLKDLETFIQKANNVSYEEAMSVFERLPFGAKDKDEFIYFRLKNNLYQFSPSWQYALIFKGKQHDRLSVEHHTQFIDVYARYFLYKTYLESISSDQPKQESKPTVAAYAIMHIFWEKYDPTKKVTKTNKKAFADKYGISDITFFAAYQEYYEKANRQSMPTGTSERKNTVRPFIQRFEHAASMLKLMCEPAYSDIVMEIEHLKIRYQAHLDKRKSNPL